MIEVKYFGELGEKVGKRSEIIDPQELSAPTLSELFAYLGKRDQDWWYALRDDRLRVAVNQEIVKQDRRILPGDEIAIFPPVTGG